MISPARGSRPDFEPAFGKAMRRRGPHGSGRHRFERRDGHVLRSPPLRLEVRGFVSDAACRIGGV
jgi:hypothetical protein